ncbi:hypothetical protein [Luteolibacter luteus]|uniref:Uncharacterized protein n=1 Tax=Luteolibacter luteus TaxID=2728835 RepID=A0A858RIV1_9BACT|nr:hypothetical protein [Luteolibacter luteus]QJE95983.1 hypothetical protein HHL09_09375 [Luteolibacter luteus]
MSIELHSGPEVSQVEYTGPNPEYLAFAFEMTAGVVADLKTPVMQRIAAVWRGEGSYAERTMATMRAAEAETTGLWLAIVSAPAEKMTYEQQRYREHFEHLERDIAITESEMIREAKERSRSRQFSEYWDQQLSPFRFPKTQQ